MSSDEIELLKVKGQNRVEMIRAMFSGSKDVILAAAAFYTIWTQQENSTKIDVAAQGAVSTLQWRAEHTGSAVDVAKAEKAEAVADKMP